MSIKTAVILSGGHGTRLRPLTFTTPKPFIRYKGEEIIFRQVSQLSQIGVKTIILATNCRLLNKYKKRLDHFCVSHNCRLILSREKTPLDTAGPLVLAKPHIEKYSNSDNFFVINGDIVHDFNLRELSREHTLGGKIVTISLKQMKETNRYGVVEFSEDGVVTKFSEKPLVSKSSTINAGIYIFNKSVFDLLPSKSEKYSMEYNLFPDLVAKSQMYCCVFDSYWADIGLNSDYLKSHIDDDSITVFCKNRAHYKPGNVFLEKNVSVGVNCILENCVILKGSVIGDNCTIRNSIIGEQCLIGENSIVSSENIGSPSVLGNGVSLSPGTNVLKSRIADHLKITSHVVKRDFM